MDAIISLERYILRFLVYAIAIYCILFPYDLCLRLFLFITIYVSLSSIQYQKPPASPPLICANALDLPLQASRCSRTKPFGDISCSRQNPQADVNRLLMSSCEHLERAQDLSPFSATPASCPVSRCAIGHRPSISNGLA
jgi:hypothetical protein